MSCVRANILTHRPGADGGSHEETRERNAVGLDMCVHRVKPYNDSSQVREYKCVCVFDGQITK